MRPVGRFLRFRPHSAREHDKIAAETAPFREVIPTAQRI